MPVNNKKVYVAIHQNKAYEFDDWPSCKSFIADKDKEVKYKSFENKEAATEFINKNVKKNIRFGEQDVCYAYIGSAWDKKAKGAKKYAYGACVTRNGEILEDFAGFACTEKEAELYKITPELTAVTNVIEYMIGCKERRIVIVFSFMGVEMWANGSWAPKDNNKFVEKYQEQIKRYSKVINIDFLSIESIGKTKKDEDFFAKARQNAFKQIGG